MPQIRVECLQLFTSKELFQKVVMKIMIPVMSVFITAATATAVGIIRDNILLHQEMMNVKAKQYTLDSLINRKLDILIGRGEDGFPKTAVRTVK